MNETFNQSSKQHSRNITPESIQPYQRGVSPDPIQPNFRSRSPDLNTLHEQHEDEDFHQKSILLMKSNSVDQKKYEQQSMKDNSNLDHQSEFIGNHQLESVVSSYKQKKEQDQTISQELLDLKFTKVQKKSIKFLEGAAEESGDIALVNKIFYNRERKKESIFAQVVSSVTFIIHSYNFFTCFFFMALVGQPTNIWLMIELVCELFMVFEGFIQLLLRFQYKQLWREMYMLHDPSGTMSKSRILRFIIVAFPTTTVLCLSYNDLSSFNIACVRLMKLLRWDEVRRYFYLYELKQRQQSGFSFYNLLFISYYFLAYTHFWVCFWIIVGRIDWSNDTAGWYKMDRFELGPSWVQIYWDSLFFIITTFSGGAFGNIIPSTNFEWVNAALLDLIGQATFTIIFMDLVQEYFMCDLPVYINANLKEQTMFFAEYAALPNNLLFKMRYFYRELNLNYMDFVLKKEIVQDMPLSIRGQVSIMLNRDIVESVNFFQLADPEFISQISCLISPQIFMHDDFIVRLGDQADKLFFIHSGYIEILDKNGIDPVMYCSKGAYFGEVGVLITGVRTLSVRSKSNSIIYYITKDDLLSLLEKWPKELEFLKSVAQQRFQTRFAQKAPKRISESHRQLTDDSDQSQNQNQIYNVQQLIGQQYPGQSSKEQRTFQSIWSSERFAHLQLSTLMPLTPLWLFWNFILIISIGINFFMVTYGIGFEQDYAYHPLLVFTFCVYVVDIPVRLKTGIFQSQISTDQQLLAKYYFNKWMLPDFISTFPFEYVIAATNSSDTARYFMLLRLIKVGRLYETFEVVRNNTRYSYSIACFFVEIFIVFWGIFHGIACVLGWVGRRELVRNPRFDGQKFFGDLTRTSYITLGPLIEMPAFDQYVICLYLIGQCMQAASYGDMILWTISEETIGIVALLITNTIKSFLIIRLAKFLGTVQLQQMEKIKKSQQIELWMKSNNLSKQFMKKIKTFNHQLVHEKNLFTGSEILTHLPVSLQKECKDVLIKSSSNPEVKSETRRFSQISQFMSSSAAISSNVGTEKTQKKDMSHHYLTYRKVKYYIEIAVLIVTTYNLCYIPVQFAYKIRFTGVLMAFELITILVYIVNVGFLLHTRQWILNLEFVNEDVLRRKDKIFVKSHHFQQKEIGKLNNQIVITAITLIPISWILTENQQAQQMNMYIIILLSSLRCINLKPIFKFFQQNQKENLVKWRLISTIIYYYCYCHWCAAVMINLAIFEDDWTANWLRRCPVPQTGGTRTDPSYRDDLSYLSIYCHALYYTVNTVSHTAIGDITAVKPHEFLANAIFGGCSVFFYCLIYADITMLVSETSSKNYKNYINNSFDVLQKLKGPEMSKKLIGQATLYMDYTYDLHEGVDQNVVLNELPVNLKQEFLLEKYKEVVQNCILLRVPSTAEVNLPLANALFKVMQTKIYLSGYFVIKVGQVMQDSIFLLSGNLTVVTQRTHECLGILLPGDYYSTEISQEVNEAFDIRFFMKSEKSVPPKLKLDPNDNLDSRSVVHLIARNFVTAGFVSVHNLNKLYNKFPILSTLMRKSNRYLFDVGRKAVEIQLEFEGIQLTRQNVIDHLEKDYERSSDIQYQEIAKHARPNSLILIGKEIKDDLKLSKALKQYVIQQMDQEQRNRFKQTFAVKTKVQTPPPFCVCCEEFIIYEHSIGRKATTYILFLNRIYVALAVPFIIGFNLKNEGPLLIAEIISYLISFVILLLGFRTPAVMESGELTLDFQHVLRSYIKNGLILELIAIWPINLIIPLFFTFENDVTQKQLYIQIALTPLKMLRMVSVGRIFYLYDQIKVDFKRFQKGLNIIGNIFFMFLIVHWSVCAWVFLIKVVECRFEMNWYYYFGLQHKKLWESYIRNFYAVVNIASSVGSGDIWGTTDLERLYFTILMCAADIVFALAFGLLAELTTNIRANNTQENFFRKIQESERIMTQSKFNSNWKDRVLQYQTYKFILKNSYKNLNEEQLRDQLPECLIKEILYITNKAMLQTLFKGMTSENLIRDLAYATSTQIFIPEEVIIARKQEIKQIYYIVEGTAMKFNKLDKPILGLKEGNFCGEFALSQNIKPKFYIKAETFTLMKVLKKSQIDRIIKSYPALHLAFTTNPSLDKKSIKRIATMEKAQFESSKSAEDSNSIEVTKSAASNYSQQSSQYSDDIQDQIADLENIQVQKGRRMTLAPSIGSINNLVNDIIRKRNSILTNAASQRYSEVRLSQIKPAQNIIIQQSSGLELALDLNYQ